MYICIYVYMSRDLNKAPYIGVVFIHRQQKLDHESLMNAGHHMTVSYARWDLNKLYRHNLVNDIQRNTCHRDIKRI